MKSPDFKAVIQDLLLSLTDQITAPNNLPNWFKVCYTIQLLAYAQHDFA